MSRLPQLYTWLASLTSAFPNLSAPQVRGLAWFSFGMVLARSCSVTAVALQLAGLLGRRFDTVKRRLREWYCEAGAKAGRRRQLDVRTCFPPCSAGSCATGPAGKSPWPSTPRRWGDALPLWTSVLCIGAVPCPWPGRSCRRPAGTPGSATGRRC